MTSTRPRRCLLVSADTRRILSRLAGERESPRQDFVEIARALDAETLSFADVGDRAPLFTRILHRWAGPAVALAWLGAQRHATTYITTAENMGLPLALLLKMRRRVSHVMIGHRLTTRIKRRLLKGLRAFDRIDTAFVYSRSQADVMRPYLGLDPSRIQQISFQVDERFFTPGAGGAGCGLVSVGRELRDYGTLFAAVEGLKAPVTVVASSPWSKREDQTRQCAIPSNVTLRQGLSSLELRELYRQAAIVVVPLQSVDWAAGVTSLFEAQACGRPVIVSDSPGIRDSVTFGTVVRVPCGDPVALRAAIDHLLTHPAEAAALGVAGRAAVERERTLDIFVARFVAACQSAEEQHKRTPRKSKP